MVHWKNGFFINWVGQQRGEGFEYHILVIGMCLALLISGGGKGSVDRAIAPDNRKK
jgi:putative oxidoreductase